VSSQTQPVVAGILGGIGSGKSAVARGLSDHLSVLIIDADRIGHDVLTFPQIKDQIRQSFGDDVFDGNDVDRKQLAALVFGSDPQHSRSLKILESIVHPEIRRQVELQIQQADGNRDVVVLDAAVMLEAGWNDLCDFIVFVDTPFEVRLDRVQRNRGWSEDELRRREASQVPLERKRLASQFVIDNSASLENAVQQFVSCLNISE
jgi:dephospho-CoA kinase